MLHYDAEGVDLFAGPGGWDHAAVQLGLRIVGIEFDHAACETRRAAGLATIEGDVRKYGPANFPNARGLIGSPPCQTFSMAGKGAGRLALDAVLTLVSRMSRREEIDLSVLADERTALVLEPLRWALEAHALDRPFEWIALEQVPTVLPVWEAMAEVLRDLGYSVATGNLQAEQYGVPQTRKRAVLVARLDGEAKLPSPTHSKYYSRTPAKLDADLSKWVSMGEALGLYGFAQEAQTGMGSLARQGRTSRPLRTDEQPSFTITGAGTDHTGKMGGCARLRMISNYGTGGDSSARGERSIDHPAATVTSKVGRNKWSDDDRRVSIAEASVLQSFPIDYPWQGGKSVQQQQVGNAIPPLLAKAILTAVI